MSDKAIDWPHEYSRKQMHDWFQESTIHHHIKADGSHHLERTKFIADKAWQAAKEQYAPRDAGLEAKAKTVHLVWANKQWEASELMGAFECDEDANAYKLWIEQRNSNRPESCDYEDDDVWLAAVEAWRKEDPESETYEFCRDISVGPMEVTPKALIGDKE